jgi:hypothetical protein
MTDRESNRPGAGTPRRTGVARRVEKPATVDSGDANGRPRVLRFDFPRIRQRGVGDISWDEWSTVFDGRNLDVVYQEHTKDGRPSNVFRLVREDD